jgi:hypothetical protein
MTIKSKKELYDILPQDLQSAKTKKIIGKIFSIGASNLWTVEYKNYELIFTFENDLVKCTGRIYVKGITSVSVIPMKQFLFKQSGLLIDVSYLKYGHFLTTDFKVLQTGVNDYNSIVQLCNSNKRSDIIYCSNDLKTIANEIIKLNKDSFRELDWNEFGSYCGKLCIKDCGMFTKGMLIDTSSSYFWKNLSPMDLLNGGSRAGLYRIFNDLSCNLGLVKLEDLENVNTNYFSCSKQSFGCSRGCTSSCYGTSANESDKRRKNIFIKLWRECFM